MNNLASPFYYAQDNYDYDQDQDYYEHNQDENNYNNYNNNYIQDNNQNINIAENYPNFCCSPLLLPGPVDIDYITLKQEIAKLDLKHCTEAIQEVRSIKAYYLWPFLQNLPTPEYNNWVLDAAKNNLFDTNNDNNTSSPLSSLSPISPIPQSPSIPITSSLKHNTKRIRKRWRKMNDKSSIKTDNNYNHNNNNNDDINDNGDNPYIGHPSTAKVLAEINRIKTIKNL